MRKLFIILFVTMAFAPFSLSAQTYEPKIIKDSLGMEGIRFIEYEPVGVCSKLIEIQIDKNDVIQSVVFTKGCSGNAKGIGALIKGMEREEAIKRLEGIPCGKRNTSCPDQLSNALKELRTK